MSYGRSHSHVAEFHGPEQFVEAGQTVLNEPTLDIAIVRDAVNFQESGIGWYEMNGERPMINQAKDWLDRTLDFEGLDNVVEAWWQDHADERFSYLGRVRDIHTNQLDASRHFDAIHPLWKTWPNLYNEHIPGPISLSLRTDPNEKHPRRFYARRLEETPIEGVTIPPSVLRLAGVGIKSMFMRPAISSVTQRPGDCVIFPNHPTPALHAVKTKTGKHDYNRAQAIIYHYWLKNETLPY